MGEIALIESFRRRIKLDESVVVGSGDDTAVIKWNGNKHLLFTCDMLLQDVHFKKSTNPRLIGQKALAVNISDIAAMGGVPRHAVVSLGIPKRTDTGFIDRMFSGMKSLADSYGVNITGGDVNSSDKLIIDTTLLGEVEKRNLVTRSGARAGILLW